MGSITLAIDPRSPAGRGRLVAWIMWAVALAWFGVDTALGVSGFFATYRQYTFAFVLVPVGAFGLALALSPAVRDWALAIDMRTLVGAQAVRVGGLAFLAAWAVGKLNGTWALWAGGIDCVVGLTALFAASYLAPARAQWQRTLLVAWMAIGFLDFAVAIPLARIVRAADPDGMASLGMPPLSWITTFLVPLAIIDYVMMAVQLRHRREPT